MTSKRNKQKTGLGGGSGSGSGVPTVSRRTMEDALLLAHMRCDANCSAATSVAHAINRFWSGLGLDARRALTSEKKHVVLQSLRKKHLHTRNCPCCQHSKVFFDGGARTYERFCTAWENQPDDAGLIDIHSPAIVGVDENAETDKSKLNKKKAAKSESKPRPRGAKRTFLDELEERENRIREVEEREREREREIEAERNRNKPEEREEDVVYVDVPTIFGDALSVKAGVISLKSSEIARDDLWTFLMERENDCQAKNKQHYKKCEICSSYHVFELFLFHTFFDNVKRAQVDEIRRQHAEACAKLLLEEEHNKKTSKKTTSKSKKRKERRSRKEACDCKCHGDGEQPAPTASPVVDQPAQAVDADGSGESGNEVSEDEVRTDEGQSSDGDLDAFVSEEENEENEVEEVEEEEPEAGDVSTEEEEEEEQGQESEEEKEVRIVEPQQQKRHEVVDDGRGWTKQTNRKKPKKAAKPEAAPVAPAKTYPPGLGPAVPTRTIPTPNRVTPPPSAAPALQTNSAPSLKRHTPFAETATKEKHRKQDDGNHLCLNQLHYHSHNHTKPAQPNKPIDALPKQSAAPAAPASSAPPAAVPALPKTPQNTSAALRTPAASTAKPAPVVPGPPPPHFPYWSRHHHNVIPKNWVWKAKKEEQSAAEAKAQAQAKALEEERKNQERQKRQEKIRSAAAVLMEAMREAGDASDVSFMKETLKELNDQATAKFCCDCAFDEPADADKQRQQTHSGPACNVPDCRDVDCYSHFDGPSLFSIDPVMFPFSRNNAAAAHVSSPSSWPSSPALDDSYPFSYAAAGEPCAPQDSLYHGHGHPQPWLLHSYT